MILKARLMEGFHTTIWKENVDIDTTKYKVFEGKTKEECEAILEECDTDEHPDLEDIWEMMMEADVTREKYTGEQVNVYIAKD